MKDKNLTLDFYAEKPEEQSTAAAQTKRSPSQAKNDQIKKLREKVKALKDQNRALETICDASHQKNLKLIRMVAALDNQCAQLRAATDELDKETEAIPPHIVSRLIRLCHPDRHNNSQAANDATTWLLARRRR